MTKILYTEINVIGIAILLMLLLNMKKSGKESITLDQKLFNLCMSANIFIFIFDSGMWLFNGNVDYISRLLNNMTTALYYISNPLICFIWLMYTDVKIKESKSGLLKRLKYYIIPVVVNTAISIISIYTGWYYFIDTANNYHRGPLFPVMALISLFYLFYASGISFYDLIKNGWTDSKSLRMLLVFFPIAIIMSAAVQIIFFGLSVIWICTMIAFTGMYLNIQNRELLTDPMTGLFNRRHLDQHLKRKINAKQNNILFAVMLDLDDFKKINDEFGHNEGDEAIITLSRLLRGICIKNEDFIAKIGGDEFIIIGERIDKESVDALTKEIKIAVAEYNQSHKKDYELHPSTGYSIYNEEYSIKSFLAAADKEMYKNKVKNKILRRENAPII